MKIIVANVILYEAERGQKFQPREGENALNIVVYEGGDETEAKAKIDSYADGADLYDSMENEENSCTRYGEDEAHEFRGFDDRGEPLPQAVMTRIFANFVT